MSADDGIRLLWLDFGEEGEQVIFILLDHVRGKILLKFNITKLHKFHAR